MYRLGREQEIVSVSTRQSLLGGIGKAGLGVLSLMPRRRTVGEISTFSNP
jgi:hypothetical protein